MCLYRKYFNHGELFIADWNRDLDGALPNCHGLLILMVIQSSYIIFEIDWRFQAIDKDTES